MAFRRKFTSRTVAMADRQVDQQVEKLLINVSGPWSDILAMVMRAGAFRPPLRLVNVAFENTVGGRFAPVGAGSPSGLVAGPDRCAREC
jgi:hypothetical protein